MDSRQGLFFSSFEVLISMLRGGNLSMKSGGAKQTSVLLQEQQIDFLRDLAERIEKEGRRKMSRCKIVEVLTKTITCIEPEIGECRSEEDVERELLKCLKKALKQV